MAKAEEEWALCRETVTLVCEQAHRWFRENAPAQAGKAGEKKRAKREGKRRSAVGQEKQRDFIIQRANILSLPTALFALQQGAYVRCDSFSVTVSIHPIEMCSHVI